MSDEEITYTTVRFHKSSELQKGGRLVETQGPRETGHRECSIPWHLIAIPLGILCSILLVAVAVLVKHIFQYSQEKHELQKNLSNLHLKYSTMQNDSYLREEMLRNKSVECKEFKDDLDSLNRTLNRCYLEIEVLDCKLRTGKSVEGYLFCCGIKCYYLIKNEQPWNECKQTCQYYSSSLLKIDDDNELKFLRLQIKSGHYWIGLSYNEKSKKWQWIDDHSSKLDLMTIKSLQTRKGCAVLSFRSIERDDCGKNHSCICEKRMDEFPESVCSRKEK
ncbi:killer cell lectin-like receptor 2 [Sigmodon hispidus]